MTVFKRLRQPFGLVLALWVGASIQLARSDTGLAVIEPADSTETFAQAMTSIFVDAPLLSEPNYDFWERIETSSDVPLLPSAKPFLSRKRLSWNVRDGSESLASLSHSRSNTSKEWIRYQAEGMQRIERTSNGRIIRDLGSPWSKVNRALSKSNLTDWFYSDGRHAASIQFGEDVATTIQPLYGLEIISTDDRRGTISRFTNGFRVEGSYAPSLHMMIDFRDQVESGNGPYYSRQELYEDRWAAVDLKGQSSTSYDVSESYLQYCGPKLSIAAGRGRHVWGPAYYGGLFLNSNSPPFDYVRFDANFESNQNDRGLYYTFLHGFLESALPGDTLYAAPNERPRTINRPKYLSAQRVEFRARRNLILGFSQGVIYGDRGVQLGYLTPMNFLYSVQHSNDDKDNLMWALDAKWRPVRGWKLYGELLLDDVVVGELFSSGGSNKSAYTVGSHVNPVEGFWNHFDGRIEYTRIRPFVYSHFFETNTYTHWYSPLGYTLEPNSEFFTIEVRGTFYPVQITARRWIQNHRVNTLDDNAGGDIYTPPDSNEGNYEFLGGIVDKKVVHEIEGTWEALPGLKIFAVVSTIQQSYLILPDRIETKMGFAWNL